MRTCLVLGGGDTLHADLAAYEGPVDGVVACNDAGKVYPGHLDAWVSLHGSYFTSKGWLKAREAAGYDPADRLFVHESVVKSIEHHDPELAKLIEVSTYNFPGHLPSGSSGLFAAKVALVDLGFDRAVLCGIPLTATPHFFDRPDQPWRPGPQYHHVWLSIAKEWRDRMRSMSGWTRVLLGPPE